MTDRPDIADLLGYLADLEAAARDRKPEAYLTRWAREHPSRWCLIIRWTRLLVTRWADDRGLEVPHAAARAQALEDMLTTAQRWAQLEARRADRLAAENRLLRDMVDAATHYLIGGIRVAWNRHHRHWEVWGDAALGGFVLLPHTETYQDLDAALARARELAQQDLKA